MEEKSNKGIFWLLIILIILVSALIVLVVYKGFFAVKLENNSANTTTLTLKTTTKKQETLTDEEIKKYLNYVPLTQTYENDAYSGKNINVRTINQEILMELAFLYSEKSNTKEEIYHEICAGYCVADDYVLVSEFNKNIKNMYNLKENDIKLSKFNAPGGRVNKNDKYYALVYGAGSSILEKINKIVDYEFINDELIINEQAGIIEVSEGGFILYKFHNNNSIIKKEETYLYGDYDKEAELISEAKQYINDNIDNYPTYKHTFKKNEDGNYYWYGTEVIN